MPKRALARILLNVVLSLTWAGFAVAEPQVQALPLLQIGQGEGPFAAAFSPDRTRVATGGRRGAFVWDVETGELLRTFVGHTGDVTAVAYSNDGAMLLTGSGDRTARLWDTNTGQALHALVGHSGEVNTVAFSPDDSLVATGSTDSSFRVWDAANGGLLRARQIPAPPGAVAFSADGAWLLVGSDDYLIRLWDWQGNFLLRTWQGHTASVMAVAFSPDGRHILSGAVNGEVKLWDFDSGLEVHGSAEHLQRVSSVTFSEDGARYLTGSADNTAILWDAISGERIRTLWPHENDVLAAVFATEEVRALSKGGLVYAWEEEKGGTEVVLSGHTWEVLSVAFSPDGSQALTGASWQDSTAKLWDAQTGAALRTLSGHTSSVSSVAVSPDGTQVLTGSWDKTAKLWDGQSGAVLRTFAEHTGEVSSVALSPDGSQVLTGSWDSTAKLWDMQTGTVRHTLSGHAAYVSSVAFSPDGSSVMTGGYDHVARMWDTGTGALLQTFSGHTSNVRSVAYSPDGTQVLTGSYDQTAKLWDSQTGVEVRALSGHTDGVNSVAFSPDGAWVLTGSFDHTAKLWDAQSGAVLRTLNGLTDTVWSVAFSPDGSQVLAGSKDTSAKIWTIGTGGIRFTLDHSSTPTFASLSPDGSLLATGSNLGTNQLRDARTGASAATLHLAHSGLVRNAIYSPNGAWLITGGDDRKAIIHDATTGAVVQTFNGHTGPVTSLDITPDGTRLLTGSDDRTARVWNVETGTTIRTLSAHEGALRGVAFSPDGAQALTASSDGTAKLWNLATGFPVREFTGPGVVPTVAQFAPDGSWILTGAEVWNPATGALIHTLAGHTGTINSAAITRDGAYILTGSSDTTARIWSASTGEALRVFSGHVGAVNVVALAPDGSRAYTGSEDGAILSWELAPPRAIIVAGGGPYAGNSIAEQTSELGVYTYRTLLARGYAPEDVLYLSAFPESTAFAGGSVVAWDIDGDGIDDVDGLATRAALEGALAGDFAREAGRLLVLMMDHGYRTGDTVAFRLNPTEAVTTTQMNAMLDTLQNIAAVDVTLVVDCCYSGQFAIDCAKSPTIPAARERIVIASTSSTTEAVFLPAPDLTSFMYTVLSSAYMGNSMGEAFRSGARFFRNFPVAGQSPRIHDGERLYTDDELFDSPANKRFFGATWAYGVQADKNINQFFPAFASVEPAGTVAPGEPVTLRATMLPFQSPERVTVAILPPAPTVLSGEPIVGLPRAELVRIGDDRAAGEVWEITLAPGDPAFPFSEEGAYRATFTAQFGFNRNSDPERTAFTITSGPDPDATSIRAVLAFGSSIHAPTAESLDGAAKYAYAVYLDRYQDPNGDRRADWIDVYTTAPLKYAKDTTRRIEQRAAEALVYTKTGAPTTSAILASIATRGAEAGRLVVHLAGDDASDATLRFGNGQTLTAAQLDAALDAITSDEIIVIIDAPGSGSFLAPLAATGDQQRVVLTSGRAGDCAIFLADPAITYTHKLLGPLWGGVSFDAAHRSADGFFRSFVGEFAGTRLAPQLDDNGDGVYTFADGQLASRLYMGRRYAFAGDEASGLPFIIESEVIPPAAPGLAATLRVRLLEGIEPATDATPDPLDAARVYAQFTPPGVLCGEGATTLPRFRLRREGATVWTWSAPISPAFLEGLGTGQHPVMFYAEYPDGSTTKMSEPVVRRLALGVGSFTGGWVSY